MPLNHLSDGVRHVVLPNGLTVLVREHRTAPVAAVVTWVKSGYFHENDDQVGLAHVAEHVYFNGTERRPGPEDIAQEVKGLGGELNAATYYDRTAYHVVLPSARLRQALDIQADAFQHPLLDPKSLQSELGAVIQEAKRKLDNPSAVARETMYALAHDVHRIRRWRIGTEEQLLGYRAEHIRRWWDDHYRPANTILAVVGDFEADDVLETVEELFGSIAVGELRREGSPPEPPREPGLRYQRLDGDVGQASFIMGFRTVPTLHDDEVPLAMAASLLGDGRASRLKRRIKDDLGLAESVTAISHQVEDVGLFDVSASLPPDRLGALRGAVQAEIDQLAATPPAPSELERAKRRAEAHHVFAQATALGQAHALAEHAAVGDYRLVDGYLERLLAVEPDDVRRVVAEHLQPGNAAIVEHVPSPFASESPTPDVASLQEELETEAIDPVAATSPTGGADADGWRTERLDDGLLLVHRHEPGLPTVSLRAAFTTGRRVETAASAGHLRLMTSLLARGTRRRRAAALSETMEGLGSTLATLASDDCWGLGTTLLSDSLDRGGELLLEALLEPAFETEEVTRERGFQLQALSRLPDQPLAHAMVLLRELLFGDTSLGTCALGTPDSLETVGPDDVREVHQRSAVPSTGILVAVGDIEWERARALADVARGAWPADTEGLPALGEVKQATGQRLVRERDKEQTSQAFGFPTVPAGHEDTVVLEVISAFTSSLGGRFFEEVRTKRGLAYVVAAMPVAFRDAGFFGCFLATSPSDEQRAREVLLDEVRRVAAEPPDDGELGRAKEYLVGTHALSRQGTAAQAGVALSTLSAGLPLSAISDYEARVRSVSRDDVVRVAEAYLDPDRASTVILRGK